MDSLWHKLQEEVVSFKSSTEEKRRIYNDLLAKDKKGVAEVAENNKKIQKLMVCTFNHRQILHILVSFKMILINNSVTIFLNLLGGCWKVKRNPSRSWRH